MCPCEGESAFVPQHLLDVTVKLTCTPQGANCGLLENISGSIFGLCELGIAAELQSFLSVGPQASVGKTRTRAGNEWDCGVGKRARVPKSKYMYFILKCMYV